MSNTPYTEAELKDRIKTKEINILTAENRKALANLEVAKTALTRIGEYEINRFAAVNMKQIAMDALETIAL